MVKTVEDFWVQRFWSLRRHSCRRWITPALDDSLAGFNRVGIAEHSMFNRFDLNVFI